MLIEHNGERMVAKPAAIEDLGTPETADDKGPLFVEFDRAGITYVRRSYTTKKEPADGSPRPFYVKLDGGFVPVEELGQFSWCEADGRVV